MRVQLGTIFLLIPFTYTSLAAEAFELSDEADRINYSIGHQIGTDFQKQGVDFDSTSIKQGMEDGFSARQPRIDRKEMNSALVGLKREISSDMRRKALAQMKARQAKTDRALSAGEAFLQANKEKDGVVALPSGLQYRVITPGSGAQPVPEDQVTFHFRSHTIDGREYNSSYKRSGPVTTRVNTTSFSGLGEALQLMQPGAKWELYLPFDLAYGRQGPLAHQTIIMEVELLRVGESEAIQASSDGRSKN